MNDDDRQRRALERALLLEESHRRLEAEYEKLREQAELRLLRRTNELEQVLVLLAAESSGPDAKTLGEFATGRLVRCGRCGRTVPCTPEDVLGFAQNGWPKCCGAVMAYYTLAPKPGTSDPTPDDTKPDQPPLPPI